MFMRMVYDEKLAQAAYLIGCQRTGEAIVVDPQRDVDRYLTLAKDNGLRVVAVAETHIHADFVSGARELAQRVNARVYVSGEGGEDWKYQWLDARVGGGSYDHRLLKQGDVFHVGNIAFRAVHTPGHTPEHLVFTVTDEGAGATEPVGVLTGDFLFVGDLGRPDLLETAAGHAGAMEPAARTLYATLRTLDDLPDFVQVWPAHGAGSACGKDLGAVPTSTMGYERRFNTAIRAATSERAFVNFILTGQPEPPLYFAEMKRVNKSGPPVLGELPVPPRLGIDELRRIDTRDNAVVDTRPWDHHRAAHLPGSMSFPIERSFNTDAGSLLKPGEPIYLVVRPADVEAVVRDLVRVGLDDIRGWCDAAEVDRAHADTEQLEEIDADQAARLIEAGEVRVLDVRRAAEFAEGHIQGAINIAHTRLAARLHDLPEDGPLLINCRSGKRSARAASFLQRHGRRVINLHGGILAWDARRAAGTPRSEPAR